MAKRLYSIGMPASLSLALPSIPVSYTHLDVYKRQIYGYVINLGAENQQLKKKQKADERFLVERNEKLQNFTENIAHQIKTPLTALSIALDRLEESGQNSELLERCFEQIERIRTFISLSLIHI